MGIKNKLAWGLLLLFLVPLRLPAEGLAAGASPDDLYQGALQAYLAGDFDQAILMDTKALQTNPQFTKAEALLSILISEKDTARKTVIWIGGKPATMEQTAPPPPPAPVTILRERVVHSAASVDGKKLAELESRVQTVAFLLERDSFNQYRELTGAQIQTTKRLDEISQGLKDVSRGMSLTNFLFLLALVIACLALWNSWRARQEIGRQKRNQDRNSSGDSRGNDRVVNLR